MYFLGYIPHNVDRFCIVTAWLLMHILPRRGAGVNVERVPKMGGATPKKFFSQKSAQHFYDIIKPTLTIQSLKKCILCIINVNNV